MFKEGAKLFGHPVHQMLIVFPLGLLATSVAFDIAALASGDPQFAQVSFWMIAAGVLGGLAAAVFGLIDWLAIPSGTRAKAVGIWHGLGNVVVMLLFVASWFVRLNGGHQVPVPAFVLSLAGAGLAVVTGWLGGELVDRLGVGVDKGANMNAPSSLSGRPAQHHPAS
jgi:uncharacterized membrane protein